jgi:hypothetical protein
MNGMTMQGNENSERSQSVPVPVPVYQFERRGETLRRKGVMKEMYLTFFKELGSIEAEVTKEIVL